MKYQSVEAFKKHLQEAYPEHLSSVYMVLGMSPEERKKITAAITFLLKKKVPKTLFFSQGAGEASLERLLEPLNTRPLFGEEVIVILEGIEDLKKEENEKLLKMIENPPSFGSLILCGNSFSHYQKAKKNVVVCDLTEEKPWEKEKRLKSWAALQAKEAGKQFDPEALESLFERVGSDFAALQKEIEKLICYVGERPLLRLKDVQDITCLKLATAGWQLAEKMIWEPSTGKEEIGDYFALIGQLRYHLQVGCQIQFFLKNGKFAGDIAKHLPSVRAKNLEKYLKVIPTLPPLFFKEALLHLFNLELALKSSPIPSEHLFDLFLLRLNFLRKRSNVASAA